MKSLPVIGVVFPVLFCLAGCPSQREEMSYISFQSDCIKQKGSIKKVVEKTLNEFPECRITGQGKYMDSDFIYVKCGNAPLLNNNFAVVESMQICEALSVMTNHQMQKILLKNRK